MGGARVQLHFTRNKSRFDKSFLGSPFVPYRLHVMHGKLRSRNPMQKRAKEYLPNSMKRLPSEENLYGWW